MQALVHSVGWSRRCICTVSQCDPIYIFPQYGETALHLAAWEGNVAIGEQLLEAGADPDIRERVRQFSME